MRRDLRLAEHPAAKVSEFCLHMSARQPGTWSAPAVMILIGTLQRQLADPIQQASVRAYPVEWLLATWDRASEKGSRDFLFQKGSECFCQADKCNLAPANDPLCAV